MYLHVGGESLVPSRQVIAILDGETARKAKETRLFLDQASAKGRIRDVSGGTINSYIVTDTHVYASAISTATIKRRVESGHRELRSFDSVEGTSRKIAVLGRYRP